MPPTQSRPAGPSPLQNFLAASAVTKIIVVTAAVYLIDNLFLNNMLTNQFLALDEGLFKGGFVGREEIKSHFRIWQLLTYGFTHAPLSGAGPGLMHIGFNMYGLWIFGRPLEQRYGSREFLCFYLSAIVLSGLIYVLWQILMGPTGFANGLIGASGGVSAVIFLFAVSFPQSRVRLLFPPIVVPMWALGVFILFMDLRGALGGGEDRIAHEAHLAGVALAMLYYGSNFSFTGGRWKEQQRQRIRKSQQTLKDKLATAPRHACTVCQRTNISDPKLDFRYCSKCDGTPCYCEEHLATHQHVTAPIDAGSSGDNPAG